MDKLEDFIRRNRADLDLYSPSPGIWRKIKRNKSAYGKFYFPKWLSIAAAFIILLGTAAIIYKSGSDRSILNLGRQSEAGIMRKNPELRETEIYYNTMVNNLYREASPLFTQNPEIEKELFLDLSHLDSIFTEIKRDLRDNVSNQEVVEALISNYRIRIQILEDMLNLLKEEENDNKKTEINAI